MQTTQPIRVLVCAACDWQSGTDPVNVPRCPRCGGTHFEPVEIRR